MNQPPFQPPPPPAAATTNYLTVESPYEVARWRPLANWALHIPHAIIAGALQYVAQAAFVINWFFVVFTGRLNGGLYGFMVMSERYNTRATLFLLGFSETYPPFDFDTETRDSGVYPPARLQLPDVPPEVSRKHLANFILAIPHYVVIFLIGIAAFFAMVGGWFAVLFTGRWPEGMRDFLVRFANYYYRVWTYVVMVDHRYPTFGLPR